MKDSKSLKTSSWGDNILEQNKQNVEKKVKKGREANLEIG